MEDFSPVDKIKGDDMEVVSFLILLSNTMQTEELGFLRLTAKSWHSQSGFRKSLTCNANKAYLGFNQALFAVQVGTFSNVGYNSLRIKEV